MSVPNFFKEKKNHSTFRPFLRSTTAGKMWGSALPRPTITSMTSKMYFDVRISGDTEYYKTGAIFTEMWFSVFFLVNFIDLWDYNQDNVLDEKSNKKWDLCHL